MSGLHPAAARGFDAAADVYDAHRPGYPRAAVDLLVRELRLAPGRTVLDLAAGTGKLTRELTATGAEVVAVEPVAGMRRVLASAQPQVAVVEGAAEAIPLPDATVDAATVAQAFHWFDAERALAELRRVLRPDGTLAVVFNRRDLSTSPQAEVDELLAPYRGATPSWSDQGWQRALDAPDGFTSPSHHEIAHDQPVDLAGLIGRVGSVSFVATLEPAQRAAIDRGLTTVFERHQREGEVVLRYRTELWITRRAS